VRTAPEVDGACLPPSTSRSTGRRWASIERACFRGVGSAGHRTSASDQARCADRPNAHRGVGLQGPLISFERIRIWVRRGAEFIASLGTFFEVLASPSGPVQQARSNEVPFWKTAKARLRQIVSTSRSPRTNPVSGWRLPPARRQSRARQSGWLHFPVSRCRHREYASLRRGRRPEAWPLPRE
jgi:hypothetical protein